MLRFVFLVLVTLIFLSVAVTLIVGALVCLVLACAVGLPLYLMARPHLERYGIAGKHNPIERLQNMYVEGKIDILEFERRVARLISVGH
jgi:uncharacterized membrane protein